ncbi:hypothetical protein SAMN02949497_3196 [Methylomagnum ishizawai]|uniref:Prealbumin-like fold domain-containing protein n=1 Tax=Methylomagnum ishizawai TaxID=1760988 RepID=A0A1Y6CZQ0_9GAMM|nr:hypothetical protein [Methylomagnum ishizawai]SMF95821.1 hypothetical protein SAMN02949497_3196 [Methylomagnum ishizawai]
MKHCLPFQAGAVLALCLAQPALAHVQYLDLDAAPSLVTTTFSGAAITDPCASYSSGCQSANDLTDFGWINGTLATLGDSHMLSVNAKFWKFHLSQTSTVTITFTQGQAKLDPAFSLYSGLLPTGSHDDTSYDSLNGTNTVDAPPGGTPCNPHNGYRDTTTHCATGGVNYWGQFDAFADWSMANNSSTWAKITYVTSVSNYGNSNFNGLTPGISGISLHYTGNQNTTADTGESVTISNLPAGDYTIAGAGEVCTATPTTILGSTYTKLTQYNNNTGITCATGSRYYGTVTYTHTP